MSSSPSDEVLKSALLELRQQNPSLGIPKVHALLLKTHSDWTVREKRVRKILQAEGLVIGPPKPRSKDEERNGKNSDKLVYPSSKLIQGLNIQQWTSKVEVKDFGLGKGKGLVATEEIEEGDVLWKEDPWIIAPEWFISALYLKANV